MNQDEEIYNCWESLLKTDWKIHDKYGNSYLTQEEFVKQMNNLSTLRRLRGISLHERICINEILRLGRKRHKELKEYIYNEPRREAQKFIGKKKIRDFIFKRDGYNCLRCGINTNLSLDHINPIYVGGKNRLMNLQTLCKSCNSWKGTKYFDYRKGGNNG